MNTKLLSSVGFSRTYFAGEKCLFFLTAHKGVFQGYTVSFENIAKERHFQGKKECWKSLNLPD